MKKNIRISILAILSLCLILCAGLFTACQSNKGVTEFTVTVKLPDGSPATGVWVQICTTDGGSCYGFASTNTVDENGTNTVTFNGQSLTDKTAELHINNIPEGYIFADSNGDEYGSHGMEITLANKSITVTLTAKAA